MTLRLFDWSLKWLSGLENPCSYSLPENSELFPDQDSHLWQIQRASINPDSITHHVLVLHVHPSDFNGEGAILHFTCGGTKGEFNTCC